METLQKTNSPLFYKCLIIISRWISKLHMQVTANELVTVFHQWIDFSTQNTTYSWYGSYSPNKSELRPHFFQGALPDNLGSHIWLYSSSIHFYLLQTFYSQLISPMHYIKHIKLPIFNHFWRTNTGISYDSI